MPKIAKRTYVEPERIMELVKASGLPVKEQAAFYRVGEGQKRLYVAKTKGVGRVDISGFKVKDKGVLDLGADEAFGGVQQQVDFSLPEAEVLRTIASALRELKGGRKAPRKAATKRPPRQAHA